MALVVGVLLGAAGSRMPAAIAGPLDLQRVDAQRGWVVHVDVEAALTSVVGRSMLTDRRSPLAGELELMRGKLGISFASDVKGVTLFGLSGCDDPGIAIIEMTDAADGLDARLGALGLPGYTRRVVSAAQLTLLGSADVAGTKGADPSDASDGLVVHSWYECEDGTPAHDATDEDSGELQRGYVTVLRGTPKAGLADVENQRLVVMAPSQARLGRALLVLAGKAPSAATTAAGEQGRTGEQGRAGDAIASPAGTILLIDVDDVPSLGPTADLTQRVQRVRMCLGEQTPEPASAATAAGEVDPELVASAWLTTESPEAAGEVARIVRDLLALFDFGDTTQPELRQMAAGLSRMDILAEGASVRLRMAAPAADVAAFVRDSGRWLPQVIEAKELASGRPKGPNDSERRGSGKKGLPLDRSGPASGQDIAEDRREHTP